MRVASEFRILGLGTVTVDHVLTVPSYPESDSKNEAIDSCYQVGGPVPIALSQLKRFGHSADFLSLWGDDAWGDVIEDRLKRENIGFRSRSRKSISSSVTQIWREQETGQRTLVTSRVDGGLLAGMVSEEFISQFDLLHLDCWPTEAALKAAEMMKEQGGLVSIDTGSPKPGVEKLLELADIVNCPQRFCQQFIGEFDLRKAAKRIAEFGPKYVTVTAGEHGAALAANGEVYFRQSRQLSRTVDTNGAGDSFSGALIHGVLRSWSHEKILEFAVACAGLKCEQLGNERALPTKEMVLRVLQDNANC
ncbi:MAG: hypothetical protein HON04_15525 [Planctomicrobium sp.]|jgi:sulfofructose kinase|nr:hypothetical protein [Planctomicrobium sp.]